MGDTVVDQTAATSTVTLQDEARSEEVPAVRLRLRKPKNDKKVKWSSGTVDNENMNKKKSKCCCIYEKPKKFGESSSEEDEDECDHCHGHVEKKIQKSPETPESPESTVSN